MQNLSPAQAFVCWLPNRESPARLASQQSETARRLAPIIVHGRLNSVFQNVRVDSTRAGFADGAIFWTSLGVRPCGVPKSTVRPGIANSIWARCVSLTLSREQAPSTSHIFFAILLPTAEVMALAATSSLFASFAATRPGLAENDGRILELNVRDLIVLSVAHSINDAVVRGKYPFVDHV